MHKRGIERQKNQLRQKTQNRIVSILKLLVPIIKVLWRLYII